MFYYKFTANTPYCGTDTEEYKAFEERPTEKELESIAEEICRNTAESFEYLINGWGGDDPTEEELENYYADCDSSYEEISQKEYEENA